MTTSFCLANATLVLEDRLMMGALHVDADRIAGIEEGDRVPDGATDCRGDLVTPGLIELHTDNLERHLEPRPEVKLPVVTAILAHDGELAAAGITTVFDSLRVGSITREGEAYKRYARPTVSEILGLRDADALRARHLIHLRAELCSQTVLEELAEFGTEDRVGLISVMDHTPGQRQFRDISKLRTYYKGRFAFSDDEFDALVAARRALGTRVRDSHQAGAIAEASRLGATLASHDDTTPDHVEAARALGITLAEFPTTLEAAEACRSAGLRIVMGAPNLIRGGSHSGNVSAGDLARSGLLDILSSDYAPALLLSSAFRLGDLWDDLPRAIRTVTATPADATGLMDRGRLRTGALADLLRIRMYGDDPVIRGVWRGGIKIG